MAPRRELLSIEQVCAELGGEKPLSKSTFYDWRAKGRAPRCIKLPNGGVRVRRDDLDSWLDDCEEAA